MTTVFLHLVKTTWLWDPSVPVFGTGRDSGGENQVQSVSEQVKVYEEFVSAYGLNNQGFFGDEAKKSTRTENRRQLQTLLNIIDTRFPKIDDLLARERLTQPRAVVAVWNFDRLSRDPAYASYIRADLALRAIVVLELSEPPLTGNSIADDLLFVVKRQGDRQVLKGISQNAQRGQATNLATCDTDPEFRKFNPAWPTQDGRYIGIADGKAPKGFRGETLQIGTKRRKRGPDADHQTMEVSPRIVQRLVVDQKSWTRCYQAWLMRHEGHTIKEIHHATRLYKNDRGYVKFFRNRIYTGDYEHSGVIYENFVPALIPRDWYEQEQARREERGKKRKGHAMSPDLEPRHVSSTVLLSGKLYCVTVPDQMHRMYAHRSRATRRRSTSNTYECSVHKHTHGEECPFYGLSQSALDQAVVGVILRDVITRDNLRPMVDTLNAQLASHQTLFTTQLHDLESQLTQAEKQRRKYAKLIDDDDDPSPTLIAELKRYEREKAALLQQKRQLQTSGSTAISTQPISDAQLDDYIARIRQVLLGEDGLLARRILDFFVERVCVQGGSTTGTLYYTFPSDFLSPNLSPLRTPSLAGGKGRYA